MCCSPVVSNDCCSHACLAYPAIPTASDSYVLEPSNEPFIQLLRQAFETRPIWAIESLFRHLKATQPQSSVAIAHLKRSVACNFCRSSSGQTLIGLSVG